MGAAKVRSRPHAASNARDQPEIALHACVLTLVFACFLCAGTREVAGRRIRACSCLHVVAAGAAAAAEAARRTLGSCQRRARRLLVACLHASDSTRVRVHAPRPAEGAVGGPRRVLGRSGSVRRGPVAMSEPCRAV